MKLVDLSEKRPLLLTVKELSDELFAVLDDERFGNLSIAEVLGTLEVVKYSIYMEAEYEE
jgi:hypothetical protein